MSLVDVPLPKDAPFLERLMVGGWMHIDGEQVLAVVYALWVRDKLSGVEAFQGIPVACDIVGDELGHLLKPRFPDRLMRQPCARQKKKSYLHKCSDHFGVQPAIVSGLHYCKLSLQQRSEMLQRALS